MAHRRNFSQRGLEPLNMDNLSLDSPPITPALAVFNSFHHSSSTKPKQYWQRTTFLSLFALILISGYVLLVSQSSLTPIAAHDHDNDHSLTGLAAQQLARLSSEAYRLAALRKHKAHASTSSSSSSHETASDIALPQLQLTPEQELAAITSFLASLPQNVLPTNINPSHPVDPQLVLDFNTRGPQAVQEVEQLVADSWARYPVVLYSKLHSPVTREMKKMLADLNLKPQPVIIEVEHRPDEDVLRPLLYRLTASTDIPILLVGGNTVGTTEEIRYMYKKGELAQKISDAGALVDGGKKKKGRKH